MLLHKSLSSAIITHMQTLKHARTWTYSWVRVTSTSDSARKKCCDSNKKLRVLRVCTEQATSDVSDMTAANILTERQ